jgi:hypothetical protein
MVKARVLIASETYADPTVFNARHQVNFTGPGSA